MAQRYAVNQVKQPAPPPLSRVMLTLPLSLHNHPPASIEKKHLLKIEIEIKIKIIIMIEWLKEDIFSIVIIISIAKT